MLAVDLRAGRRLDLRLRGTMDKVDAATRSRIMGRIRGKDTKPELALRAFLHAAGVRYRVHNRRVPGTPDVSHSGARVAVFLDGCFWHGCPRHYSRPRTRQAFWDAKLARNVERRAEVLQELVGWRVFEVWECDVRERQAQLGAEIAQAIRQRVS